MMPGCHQDPVEPPLGAGEDQQALGREHRAQRDRQHEQRRERRLPRNLPRSLNAIGIETITLKSAAGMASRIVIQTESNTKGSLKNAM